MTTYQASWDDVNDRVDVAVGVLISCDPAEVALLAQKADAAMLPLIKELLKIKDAAYAQPTLL